MIKKENVKNIETLYNYVKQEYKEALSQYSEEDCDSTNIEVYALNEFNGGRYQAFHEVIELIQQIDKNNLEPELCGQDIKES